jgi:phosphatidate phosphatase APP1
VKLSSPARWLALVVALAEPGNALAGRDAITLYPGFGDSRGAIVEGRVIERRYGGAPGAQDGELRNLLRNARLFKNDERKHKPVTLRLGHGEWQTTTDQEGYFRVELPPASLPAAGWHKPSAHTAAGEGMGDLLVLPLENRRGLISDLDDTIVVTQVNSKARMLGNTFLKSPAQRAAVGGMAHLYARVMAANPQPDAAPLIYLSASPRQLHDPIAQFLALNAFPKGVLITKRVTDDRTSDPLIDQFAYKTRKIEEILARWPQVRFVLVGDDGERDPEIYDWVRSRHPDRVEAIWIRHVNPDAQRPRIAGQRDLAEVLRESARPMR